MIGTLWLGFGGINLRLERGSDFFALERKARSASERSAEAGRAGSGRVKKSAARGGEVGGDGFHAASFIPASGVVGFRFLSYTSAGVLLPRF